MDIFLKFSCVLLFNITLSHSVKALFGRIRNFESTFIRPENKENVYTNPQNIQNTYIRPESIEKIKYDVPSFIDLMVYLPVLNRIVNYCERNKTILSINLVHGLFLIDVNLGPFVTDDVIPEALRIDLKSLIARTDKLRIDFNSAKGSKFKKVLAALASDATSWSKRVPKLNFDLLKNTYAHGQYPKWEKYVSTTENIDRGIPSPRQSDKCVAALAESEENLSEDINWRCKLPNECYESLVNGTDFGYWLTHRLIMFLHARFSRNCAIFSANVDQLYRMDFCEKIYREVGYIAMNNFEIVDLPMEQIALCALDGNAQFLRRSWLISILKYQQPNGCFQLYKLKQTDIPNTEDCNDHAMAVALATFSAAIRLILDNLKKCMER